MYRLMIAMAEQAKDEPVPYNWAAEDDQERAESLEAKAKHGLEELHDKMPMEEKK
jgi:hypothetical protein